MTRQENLLKLEDFCRLLNESFCQVGLDGTKAADIWRDCVSGECLRCGIRVSGEELFALSVPPCELYATPKLGRLRLGYCARRGCEGWTYRLEFKPSSTVDWAEALSRIDTERSRRRPQRPPWRSLLKPPPTFQRAVLALALFLLLMLAREWRMGGRIPLIREPEDFRVDVVPEVDVPTVGANQYFDEE